MIPQLIDRKIHLNKTLADSYHSFPHFLKVWHYHPELELVLVTKSTGTLLVGETLEGFKSGDLFLIGSNVPHILRNDKEYYKEKTGLRAEAQVVHFNKEFIENNIFNLPEAARLRSFLIDAKKAIKFSRNTSESVGRLMAEMSKMNGFEKIMQLLNLFQLLSRDENYKVIGKKGVNTPHSKTQNYRMDKVHDFILSNFRDNIRLGKLADLASMNSASFCRYFKKINGKTLSRYINELRVSHACKLLQENQMSISQICYNSGFNNISNFNRQFRSIAEMSPTEYIRRFHEELGA